MTAISPKPFLCRCVLITAVMFIGAHASGEGAIQTPPRPPMPQSFLATEDDQAGRVARILAKRFRSVPNQRGQVRGQWLVDPSALWQIRPTDECLEALDRAGVDATPHHYAPVPIATPVVLRDKVGGVLFRKTRHDADFIVSCELAARLPVIASVVSRYGVHTVDVLSSYRREPLTSFHTAGLGLDFVSFQTDRGEVNVESHFVMTPGPSTCYAPTPSDWRAATLLNIACDLVNTHMFSTVITPNYRRGHDDHFHIDARPNDPRIYVR